MDKRLGTFVVIEGTEGTGKAAQCELLVERLCSEGHDVLLLDFPQYNQESSYFTREYLDGKYGAPDSVSPYTASMFYALDRYTAAGAIRTALDAGKVVIANRFTGSSMAQQGAKFAHPEERRGYFIWLDNLEFQMLGIPRPDRSIVLRKESSQDNRPSESTEVYDDMCNLFPRDFYRIDCVRSGKELSTEVIQDTIWNVVEPFLAPTKNKQGSIERFDDSKTVEPATNMHDRHFTDGNYAYTVPNTLSKELADQYSQSIDSITKLHSQMLPKLTTYLSATSEVPRAERDSSWEDEITNKVIELLDLVLPVAIAAQKQPTIVTTHSKESQNDTTALTGHSVDHTEAIRLATFHPRNELELASELAYQSSELSLVEVTQAITKLPYEQKEQLLVSGVSTVLKSEPVSLPGLHYTWDLLTSIKDQITLSTLITGQFTKQALSPRYGYDMPKIIEDAGLIEEFETCFDISLKLHSLLQAQGHDTEAQYATLLGHKTRCKLTHGLKGVIDIYKSGQNNTYALKMQEKLTEVHPLISEATKSTFTK